MEEPQMNSPGQTKAESGAGRSDWLADAKRFNAQQIRRRMKEQKERYSSKLVAPEPSFSMASSPQKMRLQKPQLAIAVSMSEDVEDGAYGDPSPGIQSPLAEFLSNDDSASDNDASAWAMMEHYHNTSGPQHRDSTEEEVPPHSSFWDNALTHESYSLELSSNDSYDMSSQSELVSANQQIFVNSSPGGQSPVHIGRAAARLQSPSPRGTSILHTSGLSSVSEDGEGKVVLWKSPVAESTVDPRPTPAKLKAQWIQEMEDDDTAESPPISLLQESMIMTDGGSTEHVIPSAASPAKKSTEKELAYKHYQNPGACSVVSDNHSMNQLSKISFQQSTNEEHTFEDTQPSVPKQAESRLARPETRMEVSNTPKPALPLPPAQLQRIGELEQKLMAQQENTVQVQSMLKDRVVELEQALRATAATPRGTIIQENPLKTLLDRNQTLVKEVRFADSTCVELSSKLSALQSENHILQRQLSTMENENKDLRANYERALVDSSSPMKTVNNSRMSVASSILLYDLTAEEGILRQVVDELKAEVSALAHEKNDPLVTSASALLSEIDNLEKAAEEDMDPDPSYTFQCLAKALQAQVHLLKKQNQMNQESKSLQVKLDAALSRNAELDEKLKRSDHDIKQSVDLSRAQEESDFLGRQLGKVQEKLDNARNEVEHERSRSIAIDNKWRTETAGQLQKILNLEEQMEKARSHISSTYGGPQSPFSMHSINMDVIHVDRDLSDAKMGLISFKRELETLLTNDNFQLSAIKSSGDDARLVTVVKMAIDKMRRQYSKLNSQVDRVVDHHCKKLEHLTETVVYLRTSLLFEAESVSTVAQTESNVKGTSSDNSAIWRSLDDDDIYERMEEARGGSYPQIESSQDLSSDFEGVSRLLSDDSTLESIFKAASDKSFHSEHDGWKKPLEAAIRECQRVRDRSIALKQELQTEKLAFSQLEMENRRLLGDFNRKQEEKVLVEQALEEAKRRIQDLQSEVDNIVCSKNISEEKRLELENRYETLETEKGTLTDLFNAVNEEKDIAMSDLHVDHKKLKGQLLSASISNEEQAKACSVLQTRINEFESKSSDAEDVMMESRCQQEDMRKERAELKIKLGKAESESVLAKETLSKLRDNSNLEVEHKNQMMKTFQVQLKDSQHDLRQFYAAFKELVDCLERDSSFFRDDQEEADSVSSLLIRFETTVSFIGSIIQNNSELKNDLDKLRDEVVELQQDFGQSKDTVEMYKVHIEEEKAQNEKLFELLRQAEQEMERSANQIREMSSTLSRLQQQESEVLEKTRAAEEESESIRKVLEVSQRERIEERSSAQEQLNRLYLELSLKEKAQNAVLSSVESLESKGSRLRQYVKKLTIKCEEWEASYERQGRSLEKLQAKNVRMRERASEVAARYKQLSGQVKSKSKGHMEDRDKWTGERNDLQRIHTQLEKELETITRELSNFEHKESS